MQRNTSGGSALRRGKTAQGAKRGVGGRSTSAQPARAGRTQSAKQPTAQDTTALGFHSEASGAGRTDWRAAITRTVTGLGYDVVDIEREARGLLRVTIDRQPERAYPTGASEFVLVEDCETVTRQLQYALEVDGVDYARLEVSSPGLDRPLRTAADYARFAGQEINLTLKLPFNGRKSWRGLLTVAEPSSDAVAGAVTAAVTPAVTAAEVGTREGTPPGHVADGESVWALQWREGKTEQVLTFTLDEVRDARLVPVLDFKGRRNKQPDEAVAPPQGASTDAAGVNGGQG